MEGKSKSDILFFLQMQPSSTKPSDCEATGVLSPEKEVGGGWVEDKLSTSTCDNDNVQLKL